MCGKCCHFGQFGHRLYVTTLEAAYFLTGGGPPQRIKSDVCPHLIDGKCLARDRRTLACRVFYCYPKAQEWQGPSTEEFHTRLRLLHNKFNVHYSYADWIIVLKALSFNG